MEIVTSCQIVPIYQGLIIAVCVPMVIQELEKLGVFLFAIQVVPTVVIVLNLTTVRVLVGGLEIFAPILLAPKLVKMVEIAQPLSFALVLLNGVDQPVKLFIPLVQQEQQPK